MRCPWDKTGRARRAGAVFSASVSCLLGAQVAGAQAPYFLVLGDLPDGADHSEAEAISDDGFYVAGSSYSASGQEVVLWTIDGAMEGLGSIHPESGSSIRANGVSSTGVVTGTATSAWPNLYQEAFVATAASGSVGIGTLGVGSLSYSWGHAISDDGVHVVGQSQGTAYLWSQASGLVALPQTVADYNSSNAYGVSSGGDYVVGVQFFLLPNGSAQPVGTRWTLAGGVVEIGETVPDATRYTPCDVSSDGQVVVGSAFDPTTADSFAFVWTPTGGIEPIPPSQDGLEPSGACNVSANGTVALGTAYVDGVFVPYLWDRWRGTTTLADRIVAAGIDPGEWEIIDALAISGDGTTIVGTALGATGRRGYVVHMPEPVGVRPIAGAIAVALTLARRRRGEPPAPDRPARDRVRYAVPGSRRCRARSPSTRGPGRHATRSDPDGRIASRTRVARWP